MKRIAQVFFLFIFSFFLFSSKVSAQIAEQITSFDSEIHVNQDTSITIIETIEYTTTLNKHGIFRYVPELYDKDGKKVLLPIGVIAVTDEKGKSIPFTSSRLDGNLTLKIGDPNKTFTGEQTYVITYVVSRALTQYEEHDELFWDITGEGWQVPILQSSGTIVSEFADITKVDCFSGEIGGNDGLCNSEFETNQAFFEYNQSVGYGDNLTVLLGFSKDNQLVFPSKAELRREWWLQHWPLFLLPLPLIVVFLYWHRKGRDVQFVSPNVFDLTPGRSTKLKPIFSRARVPFVYEPLKDLTPGEAGALLQEKATSKDVVSEILELARKKYLKITHTEDTVFFLTKRDYHFKKLVGSTEPLTELQTYLLGKIFRTKDEVKLSELKGSFTST